MMEGTTSIGRLAGKLAPVVVVFALVGGCGQPGGEDREGASASSAEAERSASADGSDFVRGVLEDGEVSAAEWQEAKQRTLECFAEAGLVGAENVELTPAGAEGLVFDGEPTSTPDRLAADRACQAKWMGSIVEVRNSMLVNPDNENWDTMVVACLIRNDLVSKGYTVDDYHEAIEAAAYAGPMEDENGNPVVLTADDISQPTLPSGMAFDDPAVEPCGTDPRNN